MVLNYLNPKQLSLYGILNNFTGYTVNHDTLMVQINEEISFNLSDIEQQISDVEQEITHIEADEEVDDELKTHKMDDLREVLEVLTVLKNKLNG